MLDDMTLFVGAIFDFMSQVFDLYTGSIVLSGILALWLVRKAVKVFRYL